MLARKFIGQKPCGAVAVDKRASAKRGLGIGDMLGHHLPKRGIGNQTLGKIAACFGVTVKD